MTRSALPAIALASLLPLLASADTVELSGGGHLTGKVQRKSDLVIVELDDEIQVAIPASRVRRVVTSDQLQAYREMAAKAGNDAEFHYQLAIWCVKGDNVPGDCEHYKRYHLRRAIALDPEHSKARSALGYTKHEGKWVLNSQLMRDRGIISRGGRRVSSEAAAIEEMEEAANVGTGKWIKEVKRLTGMVLRNSSKSAEALEALKAIQDPLAASAIAAQLKESRERGTQSRGLRLLWVKLLGRFRNGVSVKSLVLAGLVEEDEAIREAALEQLVDYGSSSAVATYLPYLKGKDNKLVNRAARALSWFPDPELAMTYVDALVTTHKTELPSGPGTQATFGQGGSNISGGTFQMGGKKKEKYDQLTNPAVLSLIKSIEPDADYGYDEQAWRRYYAQKRSAFSGDLRRDP
jgi:hypothetical protein